MRTLRDIRNEEKLSLYGRQFVDVNFNTFSQYLPTVRPFLRAFGALHNMRKNNDVWYKTPIQRSFVEPVLTHFEDYGISADRIIYQGKDILADIQSYEPDLVLESDPNTYKYLKEQGYDKATLVNFPVKSDTPDTADSLDALYPPLTFDDYTLWRQYYTLEQPVVFTGNVVHGFGRGSRTLGFPTANIEPLNERVLQLVPGVYACNCVLNGESFKSALSIGWNPQFNHDQKVCEAYLIHVFEEDFYGDEMTLEILAYIRAETSFKGIDELIEAISYDVRLAGEILSADA